MRLQVYLARTGLATSRRKAEELIKAGKVKINKQTAKLGARINPNKDIVEVDGKTIRPISKKLYIMLNKPIGYLVAKSDSKGRKLAYDLLKEHSINKEKLSEEEFNSLFNVGRLDYNTEGLLLFTNDGNFALNLTHPRYRVRKVYIAKVKGIISNKAIKKIEHGVYIKVKENGKIVEEYKSQPAKVRILGRGKKGYSVLVIKIAEGRKREVRRICATVGYPVLSLKRIQIGTLQLGDLPVGKWRFLTKKELDRLKKYLVLKSSKYIK
ncbi:MAG: pseudouridine synthase [Candidatus Nanoarchaeia archaeon]